MTLNTTETLHLYRKRAQRYDMAMWIYRMAGFHIDQYRRDTVAALALQPGDTVVELGCGTGLNFLLIERAIGPEGRLIGVDLTDAMLAQAQKRVQSAGWQNVELVQADLARFQFPANVAGILSTLAITLASEYDEIIRNSAAALKPGGRLAVMDMKRPDHWPEWLVRFAAWLNKPYGVSIELQDRHPWESIDRYLTTVLFKEYYAGALYLAAGEKKAAHSPSGETNV